MSKCRLQKNANQGLQSIFGECLNFVRRIRVLKSPSHSEAFLCPIRSDPKQEWNNRSLFRTSLIRYCPSSLPLHLHGKCILCAVHLFFYLYSDIIFKDRRSFSTCVDLIHQGRMEVISEKIAGKIPSERLRWRREITPALFHSRFQYKVVKVVKTRQALFAIDIIFIVQRQLTHWVHENCSNPDLMFITTLSTCSVASYKTGKICLMALFLMFLWYIAGLQPPCRAWWDGWFDTASLWVATNQWQLQRWAITAAKMAGHRPRAAGAFEEHGSFRCALGISVPCNRSVGMFGLTRLCGIRSNLCSSI